MASSNGGGGAGAHVASSIRRGVSVADILKKFDQKKHIQLGGHKRVQNGRNQQQQGGSSVPSLQLHFCFEIFN